MQKVNGGALQGEVTYSTVMPSAGPRGSRGSFSRPAIALLLTVVVALAIVRGWQPLHLHHGDSPGIYNEEHVLAALDSATGDVPLTAHGSGVALDLARTPAHLAGSTRPDASLTRLADSRAPPLV